MREEKEKEEEIDKGGDRSCDFQSCHILVTAQSQQKENGEMDDPMMREGLHPASSPLPVELFENGEPNNEENSVLSQKRLVARFGYNYLLPEYVKGGHAKCANCEKDNLQSGYHLKPFIDLCVDCQRSLFETRFAYFLKNNKQLQEERITKRNDFLKKNSLRKFPRRCIYFRPSYSCFT